MKFKVLKIFSSVIFMIKDSLKHFANTLDADYWYNKDFNTTDNHFSEL